MKLLFLWGGGKWDDDATPLKNAYEQRLTRTEDVEERIVVSKGKTPEEIRNAESIALLLAIKPTDFVIAFDERGKKLNSENFATLLDRAEAEGKRIVVLVGGAFGMNEDVRARANAVVAFGDMIFPHDLARIMAMEQTYRALAIRRGSPYHHAG